MTISAVMVYEEIRALSSMLSGRMILSGSYFICGKVTTDVDVFMLRTTYNRKRLEDLGYELCIEDYENAPFLSYRKGVFNVILIDSEDELKNIDKATKICKELSLTNKEDRIKVFDILRYGDTPEPTTTKTKENTNDFDDSIF